MTKSTLPRIKIPLITDRKSALLSTIWTQRRRRNGKFLTGYHWRNLVIKNQILIGNLENSSAISAISTIFRKHGNCSIIIVMKITKAVIPAAGFGTRFLPATKSQPKEMLPIVDKPVIQYLVEEAVKSGIKEIILITGRGKRAIEDHFDVSWELETALNKKGDKKLLEEIRKIAKLAEFIYVRQPEPLGDGDAILHAKKILKNEPFLIMFGDSIIDSKIPAAKQLMKAYKKTQKTVVGVTEVPDSEISNYGIVKPKSNQTTFEIEEMIEKPSREKAPGNLAIVGKYIVTPEIFDALENAKSGDGKELRLIDGMRELQKTQKIYGHILDGTFHDTGNKFGMLKATLHFALQRKDLAPELKKYLKNVFRDISK